MILDDSQQQAIDSVLSTDSLSVITGGPGTGKTTIVKKLLKTLWENDKFHPLNTYMMTPTGKASKVLHDSLQADKDFYLNVFNNPGTIHRILGCRGKVWKYDEFNPLPADLLIIDESSMIDSQLLARVIVSIRPDCKIILCGDAAQLQPVSAGCPFLDICQNKNKLTVSRLNINHRQKQGSLIANACDLIIQGKLPLFGAPNGHTLKKDRPDDLFFHEYEDKLDVPAAVVNLCKTWQENKEDYQVLSPQRTGVCGVENLNKFLQAELNPPAVGKVQLQVAPWLVFRVGDKILNTKNNYDLDIFNGFTGIVKSVNNRDGSLVVDFDGQVVEFCEKKDIRNLVLGYVLTLHKAQGSEFKKGVVVCHTSHFYMLSRSLIYVGVSRFRDELHIVGDMRGLKRAVKNDTAQKRNTFLNEALSLGSGVMEISKQ